LGKPYEIKPRCYWEYLGGNAFENTLETWEPFEPIENMMRTHWEKRINQKIPVFPSPKREKIGLFVSAC